LIELKRACRLAINAGSRSDIIIVLEEERPLPIATLGANEAEFFHLRVDCTPLGDDTEDSNELAKMPLP
jgi:hypothetical protein